MMHFVKILKQVFFLALAPSQKYYFLAYLNITAIRYVGGNMAIASTVKTELDSLFP